eukprot:scaffold12295_cov45-Phaeocystis_antarctica.AAC.1
MLSSSRQAAYRRQCSRVRFIATSRWCGCTPGPGHTAPVTRYSEHTGKNERYRGSGMKGIGIHVRCTHRVGVRFRATPRLLPF